MATISMGDSPASTNSRVWWGIAIVLAILLMSRSPRDSQTLSGSSSVVQSRNAGTTATPGMTTSNRATNTNGAAATTTDAAAPATDQPANPGTSPESAAPPPANN